jgi:hypothetical protein
MFEYVLDELRLRRFMQADLDPALFRHLRTVKSSEAPEKQCNGWALWVAGESKDTVALAWPWSFIQPGVPAIDPLKIQSNLLLLDDKGELLSEYQTVATLVYLVNRLDWNSQANTACAGSPAHLIGRPSAEGFI